MDTDTKKIFGIIALASFLFLLVGIFTGITVFDIQPSQIFINSDTAETKQGQTQAQLDSQHDWIKDGNSVYINDSNVFLDFTPHTSNEPIVTLISKQYSGDIDLVVGFDTSLVKPKGASVPYKTNVTKSYTCEYEMNYTTDPNYFWCFRNVTYQDNQTNETITTNEIEVVFEHSFDSGNVETQTASWNEEVTRFNDISDNFKAVDIEYQNYTKWYYMQGVNVEAGKEYKMRLELQPVSPFTNQEFKYFFGIKPSQETLQEAISNEHFYYIDPWTASLETDLKAWYKLDKTTGDVIDWTGTYNGTNNGTTRGVTGKINNSFDFEESNSDNIETNSVIDLDNTKGVTVSLWFKFETVSSGYTIFYQSQDTSSGDVDFSIYYRGTNNDNFGVTYGQAVLFSDAIPDLLAEKWYHIVGTYNTNGTTNIYLNGTNIGSGTISPSEITPTRTLISGHPKNNVYFMDGKIDELGIWSRALTSTEVSDLYNSGSGLTPTSEEPDNPPSITINTPTTADYTTLQDITINCTASDDINLTSVSYSVNGSVQATNSSGINNTDYVWEWLNVGDGNYNISCTAEDNESQTTTTANATININTTPNINFVSPTYANETDLPGDYIPVNISLTETYFENLTMYFYKGNTLNETITFTNSTRFYNKTGCQCDTWKVNATTCTTTGQCNSTETRTYFIDVVAPTLSDTYNLTDLFTLNEDINSTWSYNASDPHIDSCYYNTSDNSTYTTVVCNSTIYTTWASGGNKTVQYCANDTFGNKNCSVDYVYVDYLTYIQAEQKDPVGEGMNVEFNLTLDLIDSPTATANFYFNGTQYSPDTTTSTQNKTVFKKTISILDGWGNTTGIVYDWYWNYSIDGLTIDDNTTIQDITVYSIAVDDCTDYGEVILNMSLRDEGSNSAVNETLIATTEIDLYITSPTDDTINVHYHNTFSNENNPQVCMPSGLLNNSEYIIDFTIGYESAGRVFEFFYLDDGTLNSSDNFDAQTTRNINLMDLNISDSTSFLFNYFDEDGLPVEDAMVNVYRYYIGEGTFREVERAKPDDNGDTIVHLVEEDVIYYFLITKNGETLYTSAEYTALCQSTPCTIQIEAGGDVVEFDDSDLWDNIPGGNYSLSYNSTTRTITLTYILNESSTMNMTVYKYDFDGSTILYGENTSTGTSGTMSLVIPQTAGNVSFYSNVWRDGEFINSEWINFEDNPQTRFGTTLSLFLAVLIILSIGLMAITEGTGTLVMVIFGVALSGFLGLITTELNTGLNVVLYLVLAGGILLWKITRRRR